MKISFLGSGTVTRTLSPALSRAGHSVFIGSRNPDDSDLLAWQTESLPSVRICSYPDSVAEADVIFLAINPWTAIEPALAAINPQDLAGKTVVDLSNDIAFGSERPELAEPQTTMGIRVQNWIPTAHVVKTLTHVPAAYMVRPNLRGLVPAAMWMAGNSTSAKANVGSLLKDLGWDQVVDLGGMEMSTLQEATGLAISVIITDVVNSATAN
jgi:8-hydroxy-5-deazaflavin:NADPH oxidoreductase